MVADVNEARGALPLPPDGKIKGAYSFRCTGCGHEQMAAVSIMMEMGMNAGAGSCMNCELHHHLEIDYRNDCMHAEVWTDWAAKEKKRLGLDKPEETNHVRH